MSPTAIPRHRTQPGREPWSTGTQGGVPRVVLPGVYQGGHARMYQDQDTLGLGSRAQDSEARSKTQPQILDSEARSKTQPQILESWTPKSGILKSALEVHFTDVRSQDPGHAALGGERP